MNMFIYCSLTCEKTKQMNNECTFKIILGRHGRDRMVVGFTTTNAKSVPITTDVVSSNLDQGVVFSTNKTDRHDITKILLKVALNK